MVDGHVMNRKTRIGILIALIIVFVVLAAYLVVGPARIQYALGLTDLNSCPVCGSDSLFRDSGDPGRSRVFCEVCGSLERHRAIYLYLEQGTDLFQREYSLLHFSPNTGLESALRKKKNLSYTSADLFGPADLKLDLTKLDLPDNSWDVILCSHVLEHIIEDRKAMSEIYRVLKPGGWALLQVPYRNTDDTYEDRSIVDPNERRKHFGQWDHVRWYGLKDYVKRLTDTGFLVTAHDFGASFRQDALTRYGLTPRQKIFLVRKPGEESVRPEG